MQGLVKHRSQVCLEGVGDVVLEAVAALHHHVDKLVEVDGSVGVGVHVPAEQKFSHRY